MKLYELTDTMARFQEAVEAGEIPEEAIGDTLEAIEMPLHEKLDECAAAYKGLLAEAQSIKDEAAKLTARAKAKEAEAARLSAYIDTCLRRMAGAGVKPKKFESARSVLSYGTSHPLDITDKAAALEVCIKDPALHGCLKEIHTVDLDKAAVKIAIKSGAIIPGVSIGTSYNLQIK